MRIDLVGTTADFRRPGPRHPLPLNDLPGKNRGTAGRIGEIGLMLTALRDNARRLGFVDLYAPLRPTDKHREPLTPFADYVARRREDGLPYYSWVRTHVRAGAQIVKVAPRSMVIAGTIAEWSRWTSLGFNASGPAILPGALSPIHVSLEQDHAVYVEPNLRLAAASIRRVLTG